MLCCIGIVLLLSFPHLVWLSRGWIGYSGRCKTSIVSMDDGSEWDRMAVGSVSLDVFRVYLYHRCMHSVNRELAQLHTAGQRICHVLSPLTCIPRSCHAPRHHDTFTWPRKRVEPASIKPSLPSAWACMFQRASLNIRPQTCSVRGTLAQNSKTPAIDKAQHSPVSSSRLHSPPSTVAPVHGRSRPQSLPPTVAPTTSRFHRLAHPDTMADIKTRLLVISDTHADQKLRLPTLQGVDVDVAIHCGDLTDG